MKKELKVETFYVWKIDPMGNLSNPLKWHGLYEDTWFLYEQSKNRVTKTNHFLLIEVEQEINKVYANIGQVRIRKEIIPASPRNIGSNPKIAELNYGQSTEVKSLDFAGLMKKDVLYIRSYQDKDLGIFENLYIDVSYKKIISEQNTDIRNRRYHLGDLRRKTLAEYQSRFPQLEFRASIISYHTYDINPACFRSFEELYEDFEREQESAMYGNYLDNLYGSDSES